MMAYYDGVAQPFSGSPNFARENPAFQRSYNNESGFSDQSLMLNSPERLQEITNTENGRRHMPKSNSRIEDILLEMPSRTLGRKSGWRAANQAHTVNSTQVDSPKLQHHALTHLDVEAGEDASDPAMLLYESIAETHGGEVPNSEIRSLPVSMGLKRRIKKQAESEREQKKTKKIGKFEMWRYSMSIKRERFREGIRRRIHSPRLWSYHVKEVEGNFGSGVSSYFSFLRGLFFLSIPSFVLNFAFISLPQLLQPQNRTDDVQFTGEELITGANWLTETIMYYGYYTNGTINRIPSAEYTMPLAYLLATAGYFLLCLLWLSKVTATSFRENYIEGKVSNSNFIGRTFCAWDYAITSKSVAELHHNIINTDLKEVLADRLRQEITRSSFQTFQLYVLRLIIWIAYFGLTGGSMFLIYIINERFLAALRDSIKDVPVLQEILLALFVSAINLILPIFINLFTHWESYKNPRVELYVAVFRNFILKLGLLAVICTFWIYSSFSSNQNPDICWETQLGQEAYRLIVIDFLFSIVFATFCAEFLRHMLSRFCIKRLNKAEFSIVNNVMDLIYGQTLCWIGVFFSPLLAVIVCIKYLLMFYVKKISVMQNCQASKKRWRAAQSSTMFNALLLISFLLCTLFIAVVVFRETPSMMCGPFRGIDHAYTAVINEFADLLTNEETEWFATLMGIITSVWFLSAINVVLAVLIVMRRSKAQGLAALGKALREQIVLEGKDKKLLLKWLEELTNQESRKHTSGGGGPSPSRGGIELPGGIKTNLQHRLPILARHNSSAASTPSRPPSELSFGDPFSGEVLTHTDPQHFVPPESLTSSPVLHRRHHDPVVRRALEKKRRPKTLYDMRTEDNSALDGPGPSQRYSYSGPLELEYIDAVVPSDSESEGSAPPGRTNVSQSNFQGNVYLQSNM